VTCPRIALSAELMGKRRFKTIQDCHKAQEKRAAALRTQLGGRPRLTDARRFALGHATPLSIVPAQQRAATTQTPRRPIGAGGARGANRSGSFLSSC
jgi:hypothetical protein